LAHAVCRYLHLEPTPPTLATLREVFATNYQMSDCVLLAENNYFLNRATLGGEHQRPPLDRLCPGLAVNRDIRYSVDRHYVPAVLPAGARHLSYHVRLTNRGDSVISSKGENPVCLSYHWLTPAGEVVEAEGDRTRLPIDLLPGRSLTVPLFLSTPGRSGAFVLVLTLVHEHVAWLDEFAASHLVTLSSAPRPAPWEDWVVTGVNHGGYDADHLAGQAMLAEEVARLGRRRLRFLEVGGCCHPNLHRLPHTIYNVDVDMQTLQLGPLCFRRPAYDIHFVCADADNLPFRDGSFDGVALFSALHHLPDPTRALAGMRRLVRGGGFVAVMCEPVGHYRNGEAAGDLVRELEHGINEQTFSLEEYHAIFTGAGLRPDRVVVDEGSLKAILRPRSSAG
jgi:SAM-dependent methyltransferase